MSSGMYFCRESPITAPFRPTYATGVSPRRSLRATIGGGETFGLGFFVPNEELGARMTDDPLELLIVAIEDGGNLDLHFLEAALVLIGCSERDEEEKREKDGFHEGSCFGSDLIN